MKILIACEFSGIVRDAFIAKGHDAVSCDLLPTERPGPHIQGDVLEILDDGWDMMIAHPPCTYLTNCGVAWFNVEKWGQKAIDRAKKRIVALDFFMYFVDAPIEKICVENPVGWVNSHYRKPDQIIHPWHFGDPHMKRTCLWLKSLPTLQHDADATLPEPLHIHKRRTGGVNKAGSLKKGYFVDRGSSRNSHIRSITFQGIANAMADQWGSL